MKQINIELPPKLLPLFQPKRFKAIYGGRGGAKSWSIARSLIALAVTRPMLIACARETQTSIVQSVHKLLKDQIKLMQLDEYFDPKEKKILCKNGSEFIFVGIRQLGVESMKSLEGVDICWIEEAQVITKRSLNVVTPTIRKAGSEIWMSLNPEFETDEVYKRYVVNPNPEFVWSQKINYTDNPFLSRELEIERLEHKRTLSEEEYENIWLGKCRPAVLGAIYGKEISQSEDHQRIRNVPVDPVLPVHTVWDLGYNDSMSIICFQVAVSEVRIVRYDEYVQSTLAYCVGELEKLGYRWGTDYLPHDGAHNCYKVGKTSQELLTAMNRDVEIVPKLGVEEGIRAARMMFPRVYFDRDNAADLVTCLKRYKRKYNNLTEEFNKPLHDINSHGADAFRYLSVIVDTVDNDAGVSYTRTQAVNWQAV